MSWTYSIFCDAEKCEDFFMSCDMNPEPKTMWDVILAAVKEGWTERSDQTHWCPFHSGNAKEQVTPMWGLAKQEEAVCTVIVKPDVMKMLTSPEQPPPVEEPPPISADMREALEGCAVLGFGKKLATKKGGEWESPSDQGGLVSGIPRGWGAAK